MAEDPAAITKLLEQAKVAEAQMGAGKAGPKRERPAAVTVPIPHPAPLPTIPTRDTNAHVLTTAMEQLVKRRGYEFGDERYEVAKRDRDDARRITEQGARSFFLDQDLPQTSLAQDPERYVNAVLSENSAYYSTVRDKLVSNKGDTKKGSSLENTVKKTKSANGSSAGISAPSTAGTMSSGSGAHKYPRGPKRTSHRTLATSLATVQQILDEPVTKKQSIFTVAQRSFLCADFLLGDVIDALATDSREMRHALELVRETYQTSMADARSGEFLLAAEIIRLKQELFETKQAMEKQRERSALLIMAMDERRRLDQQRSQECIAAVEEKRADEVGAALKRAGEYGEQIRVLRAMVDAIKSDQQVREVELMKSDLEATKALNRDYEKKIAQMGEAMQALQQTHTRLQEEGRELNNTIAQLRGEVKALNSSKEYCRGCSNRIVEKSKYLGSEIADRVARMERVSGALSGLQGNREKLQMALDSPGVTDYLLEKERTVIKYFETLQEQAKEGVSAVDSRDENYHLISLSSLAKTICLVEARLEVAPKLQQLDDELTALKYENARLKNVDQELLELKKAYRDVLSRSQESAAASASMGFGVGQLKDSHLASAQHQGIYENTITLLREQPLQLLITKNIKIKLQDHQVRGQAVSELTTTPGYVASTIVLFLRHLCMTAFTGHNPFSSQLSGRLLPRADGTPYPTTYPIQALFTGWVHAQFHTVPEDKRLFEAELLINKVVYCLTVFQHSSAEGVVEDESMTLSLGALLLNATVSPDELMFIIYIAVLAYGGLPDAFPGLLPQLPSNVTVKTPFISLHRALNIILATVSKTVQKGFIDAFIQQGRATSLIRDVAYADIAEKRVYLIDVYENIDGNDMYDDEVREIFAASKEYVSDKEGGVTASSTVSSGVQAKYTRISVANINFFLVSMLKAYRTEVMTRLEATRLMYAGSLLETSTLLRNAKTTGFPDAMKFRIVREIIRTINPICDDGMVDAAYLDIIWRSPSANWPIVVDACRTRGVFSTALKFPPMEVLMPVIGGYHTGATSPSVQPTPGGPVAVAAYANAYDDLMARTRTLIERAKVVLLHLSDAMGVESAVATRTVVQELANVEKTSLTFDTLGLVLNALRSTLLYSIELAYSVISACGRDFGIESSTVRRSLGEGRGVTLRKTKRQPVEIFLDSAHYLTGALAAALGWDTNVEMCLNSLSMRPRSGRK
ncbi:hypothetical protein GMRT_13362 [Giardia muris]|uniref:Uncharacterized protein n=1 Tax=Giardia muris TaxID=5742 RepID=A0A4Z1SRR5_GIAMU|nr:hypothetical protein GMRT_13362 [Giardia muris]|eukprot:TNJ26328.1 hypothetical protein GMRT_13362 [Giardia muris]